MDGVVVCGEKAACEALFVTGKPIWVEGRTSYNSSEVLVNVGKGSL